MQHCPCIVKNHFYWSEKKNYLCSLPFYDQIVLLLSFLSPRGPDSWSFSVVWLALCPSPSCSSLGSPLRSTGALAWRHPFWLCCWFCCLCSWGLPGKSLPLPACSRAFLMLSSAHLMASACRFRSLVHFDMIFVCSLRWGCCFTLWHMQLQFSQNRLLKRLFFFQGLILAC